MKFFGQLFDAPAEIVIAHGRVVLAAFSLAAITIDPSEPQRLVPFVSTTILLYAAYSVLILAALHWRIFANLNGAMIHALDLAIVALLLFLTQGFSSPFLVFFTFALLAASLRWDWQGIAVTMAVLILIAVILAAIDFLDDGKTSDVNQSLIRTAYLIATGTILAYASAHREHEHGRLLKLAHWPALASADDQSAPLKEVLRQAAGVLEASRAVVVWEEQGGGSKAALWQAGQTQIIESSSGLPAIMVAPEVAHVAFSRTAPTLNRLNLINGSVRVVPKVLCGELVSRLRIRDFASAPFEGLAAKGRLFILGNIRPSDDHLPLTRILADRVGAELDRQIFQKRAAQGAAMRERAAIMRDLHDGLLQNLTAARTHLELLPSQGELAAADLQKVRELLRIEQRRIREFVDATQSADNEMIALGMLHPLAEETGRLWGCEIALTIRPETAMFPRKIFNQLSLMLAEGVANAVRHAEAGTVRVAVVSADNLLTLEMRDDGRGFPVHATTGPPLELLDADLPRSLNARVKELGGRMYGYTSLDGSVLRFELPA